MTRNGDEGTQLALHKGTQGSRRALLRAILHFISGAIWRLERRMRGVIITEG